MPPNLKPEFRKAFLDEVLRVERFLGRHNERVGRDFTRAVFEFAYSVVATVPEGFPREYALLYRLNEQELDFVYFYHTRRDTSAVKFDV